MLPLAKTENRSQQPIPVNFDQPPKPEQRATKPGWTAKNCRRLFDKLFNAHIYRYPGKNLIGRRKLQEIYRQEEACIFFQIPQLGRNSLRQLMAAAETSCIQKFWSGRIGPATEHRRSFAAQIRALTELKVSGFYPHHPIDKLGFTLFIR